MWRWRVTILPFAAQIWISHAFMIQEIHTSIGKFDVSEEDDHFMEKFVKNAVYDDYDRLVQLCDSLAVPYMKLCLVWWKIVSDSYEK